MVTALMVKPGEQPCMCQLVDDGDYLDCAVSVGDNLMCSATSLKLEKGVVAIHAWEGVSLGRKGNRKIGKRIIAGTFYIVRVRDGHLQSLTEKDIVKYTLRFWEIEEYTDDETIDSWLDGLF